MTKSTLDRLDEVSIALPSGRSIPIERLVGVAELAELFTERMNDLINVEPKPFEITRAQVSTWASRHRTSQFPLPLPTRLKRGLLWDIDDFVDPETGQLKWIGPPGRWGQSNDLDIE